MTLRQATRIAACLALLLSALAIRPAPGAAAAHPPTARGSAARTPATPDDLTSVGDDATLPATGAVRFVRSSPDGRLLFAGLAGGAIERSADAGQSWRQVPRGVPGGPCSQILDLQISPANPRVVWAAGLCGVYRSTDSGLTWSETDTRSDGPGRAIGSALAVDARHAVTAYLVGYRDGGLYRTVDGGSTWQETISYPVSGVAIDPADGAIVYALSRTAGLQRSEDHGLTWSKGVQLGRYAGVGQETADAGRLLAVPGPGAGVYAALDGGGLKRSRDGGRTWQDISAGLPQSSPGYGYQVPFDLTSTYGISPTLYLIVPGGSPGGMLYSAAVADLNAAPPSGPIAVPVAIQPSTTTAATNTATATPSVDTTATNSASATPPVDTTVTATATPTTTAVPALWRLARAHVDAVAPMPSVGSGALLADEDAVAPGSAAVVATLGGRRLLDVPYILPPPLVRIAGNGFASGATRLPYLYGVNYEGPNDRPWQLWQDGKFDPALVARDLDAAASAGYRVVRAFVQDPLPAQVLAGEFGHLDTLVALAQQRDLRLLLTFNDSRDPNLARVAMVDRAIAAHYARNPAIFGYDLRNEPAFTDIIGAQYPAGVGLPVLDAGLVDHYRQRISLKQIVKARARGSYASGPYSAMTDRQAWVYTNISMLLDACLAADGDYQTAAADPVWQPLMRAFNASLAIYIAVQRDAIRAVDANHLITIGYNRLFWATMPANDVLDFRSIHIYPNALDWASIHDSLRTFENLRAAAPTPLVLGEYGFSTAQQSGALASLQETVMGLYLRVLGGAGDLKWMLNDDLVGYNAYENDLGLFGAGMTPKPAYYVNREIAAYFGGPHQPGGVQIADAKSGVYYRYAAPDALGVSGAAYPPAGTTDARLHYRATGGLASTQLWLDWAQPGRLRIVCSQDADLWLDLGKLAGAALGRVSLSPPQAFDQVGLQLHVHLHPGAWYTVSYTPGAVLPQLAAALPAPMLSQGWYILSAGHNVVPPLFKTWLALGGAGMAGAPLDEAQPDAGGLTQYYENIALHADAGGHVTLLPLGADCYGHADPPAAALPKKVPHLYVAATGHNLRGAFLDLYRSTGGATTWGVPLDEEGVRGGLTVQYFSNAEFVWDGASVSLGALGSRTWNAAG